MLDTQGKEDIIAHLKSDGFNEYDAEKAYTSFLSFLRESMTKGDHIVLRGVLKIEARKRNPRVFKDNLNGKDIHFGERIEYGVKDYVNN